MKIPNHSDGSPVKFPNYYKGAAFVVVIACEDCDYVEEHIARNEAGYEKVISEMKCPACKLGRPIYE